MRSNDTDYSPERRQFTENLRGRTRIATYYPELPFFHTNNNNPLLR